MKEFKSIYPECAKDRLMIEAEDEALNIRVESPSNRRGLCINTADAPALALAILEESGVTPVFHESCMVGEPEYLENIACSLNNYLIERDRLAAEQAEQKKLEEEALELANTMLELQCYELFPGSEFIPIASWDREQSEICEKWLAVARKARELGANK